MVAKRIDEMSRVLADLTVRSSYPASSSDIVQTSWMDLAELDAIVAGYLTTALHGGRVSRSEVKSAQEQLQRRRDWSRLWPQQSERLSHACTLLLNECA